MSNSAKGGNVSSTRTLLSASALMAAGTLASRALGILRTMLLAFILGNGTRQADIFNLSQTIPNGIYILFAGGALNTVLVPQIVRAIRHDEDGGEAFTNRIVTAFMLVISVVTVVMTIAAPLITHLYTSDAWRVPELATQYGSMVALAYLTMPQIFFYGVYMILGQVLNARDRFGPMMWAPIANNVISILVVVIYLVVWGSGGDHSGAFTTEQIWLLGLGSTLGIVAQALILVPFIKKIGFKFRPRFDLKGTGLGKTFQLTKWTLGFVAVNQIVLMLINQLATSATATGAGGGANVYANAHLMWILPHSLITVSLATAMLPNASRLAAAGDLDGVADEARKTMRLSLIALVPSAFVFIALSGPIAVLLFGHGQGSHDAVLIAWALMAFALGSVPFTIQFVCLRTFYALENTKTPFLLQCVIGTVNAAGALALVHLAANPSWTAAALALSYSIAYVVGVQLSWRQLKRLVPALNGRELLLHVARLAIGSAVGSVPAWFVADWVMRTIPGGIVGPLLGLLLGGALIGGSFIGIGKLLKIRELSSLSDLVRSRFRRGPSSPTETDEEDTERSSAPHVPSIAPEPATAAALVDDLMPTGLHTIIADGGFNGWDTAKIPGQFPAPPAPAMPPLPRDEAQITTDDILATNINPAISDIPTPVSSTSPLTPATPPRPQPVSASGQQLMQPGDLLSTRFRLEELLEVRGGIETWRSHDLVLSRDVVAHVLPASSPHVHDLLQAARKGAVATDSRFLRVLDAVSLTEDPRGLGGYVVCEFARGHSLMELLQRGPLSTLEAAWIIRELADALTSLHGQGLFHEQLNPDNVIITKLGSVKLVGFGVEAGFHPQASVRWSDREAADVRGLASLLYAMLVCHWPGGAAWGLPAAPIIAGETAPPHQVATGVSPALDRICSATLTERGAAADRRITTAAQLAAALASVLGTADASADLEARVRQAEQAALGRGPAPQQRSAVSPARVSPPTQVQPRVHPTAPPAPEPASSTVNDEEDEIPVKRTPYAGRPLLWAVLIGAVATLVISLLIVALNGANSGNTPPTAPGSNGAPSTTDGANPAAGSVVPVVQATDFDPVADNGSGNENPEDVAKATDGDPATGWPTMRYRGSAKMGGEKPGVGLVLDLGEAVPIGSVDVTFADPGTTVQLRVPKQAEAQEAPMTRESDWRTVAETTDESGQVTLTPGEATTSRYVLVYVTQLPEVEQGRYLTTIHEIVVKRG